MKWHPHPDPPPSRGRGNGAQEGGVFRFWNNEVLKDADAVIEAILIEVAPPP